MKKILLTTLFLAIPFTAAAAISVPWYTTDSGNATATPAAIAPNLYVPNNVQVGGKIYGTVSLIANGDVSVTGKLSVGSSTPWALLSVNPNAIGSGVPEFAIGSSTQTDFVVYNTGSLGSQVRAGYGSAAKPTYSFVGNPATGMWADNPNQVTISANGTEAARFLVGACFSGTCGKLSNPGNTAYLGIDTAGAISLTSNSSQNVTLNPGTSGLAIVSGAGFQVNGGYVYSDRTSTPNFVMNSGGANYGQIFNQGTTGFSLGYSSSLNVIGTPVLTWNSSGNVGIGTSTPSKLLSVQGDSIISGTENVANLNATGTIALPNTTSSAAGVVTVGGSRFIHTYALSGTDGYNTFMGINSGNFTMTGSTGTQGSYNTAFGNNTLTLNTTGNFNTAIGKGALPANTTGSENTSIGYRTLELNTTGVRNTALGNLALRPVVSGSDNTGIGYGSLGSATDIQNSALGAYSAGDITSGHGNLILGYNTGRGITTGSGNTIVGNAIGSLATGLTNNIIFASGDTTRAQFDGTNWNFTGNVGIGTTSPGAKFAINNNTNDTVGQALFLIASSTSNATTTSFIVTNGGNVGIGTTSPYANLSVQSGASTGDAFVVATSSAASIAGYDNDGHRFTSGPAPAISVCGTGTGTVVGDDQSGTITTATAATACTVTFAKAYRNTPTCTVTDNSLVGFADVASISTSAVTFGISSALTGGNLYYSCNYHK